MGIAMVIAIVFSAFKFEILLDELDAKQRELKQTTMLLTEQKSTIKELKTNATQQEETVKKLQSNEKELEEAVSEQKSTIQAKEREIETLKKKRVAMAATETKRGGSIKKPINETKTTPKQTVAKAATPQESPSKEITQPKIAKKKENSTPPKRPSTVTVAPSKPTVAPSTEKPVEHTDTPAPSRQSDNWRTVEVTFYSISADQGTSSGITASGAPVQEGVTIACDTNVYPLGTKLEIEGLGVRTCQDTGSAINGDIIDVYVESKDKAFQLGRQTRRVRVVS